MNIIIEGIDCVGKDTQIAFIETEIAKRNKVSHVFHYSNIKLTDNKEIEKASKLRYREMFSILNMSSDLNNFIMNRSHLGEAIYSPIYRSYSGDYVFDYEKAFLSKAHQPTKLVLFLDDAEKIIERDKKRGDGLSFSLDIDKKNQEIEAFKKAFEKSSLDKKLIYLKGRGPEEIFTQEVYPFLFEN